MRPQQHLHPVQLFHLLVVDGDEAQLLEPFTFHTVVHYVAQAVECLSCCQFLFRFLYGSGHSEAESAAVVNLYLYHSVLS